MKKFDFSMQGLFGYLCIIASILFNGIAGVTQGSTVVFFLGLSIIALAIGLVSIVNVKNHVEEF